MKDFSSYKMTWAELFACKAELEYMLKILTEYDEYSIREELDGINFLLGADE